MYTPSLLHPAYSPAFSPVHHRDPVTDPTREELKKDLEKISGQRYASLNAARRTRDELELAQRSNDPDKVKRLQKWHDVYLNEARGYLAQEQMLVMLINNGDPQALQQYVAVQKQQITETAQTGAFDVTPDELNAELGMVDGIATTTEKSFLLLEAYGRRQGDMDNPTYRHTYYNSLIAHKGELTSSWKEIGSATIQVNVMTNGMIYQNGKSPGFANPPEALKQIPVAADVAMYGEREHAENILAGQPFGVAATFVYQDGSGRLHISRVYPPDAKANHPSITEFERNLQTKLNAYNAAWEKYQKQSDDMIPDFLDSRKMPTIPVEAKQVTVHKHDNGGLFTLDDVAAYVKVGGMDLNKLG